MFSFAYVRMCVGNPNVSVGKASCLSIQRQQTYSIDSPLILELKHLRSCWLAFTEKGITNGP